LRYFCWFFLFFALALGSCNSSEKTEKKYHPLEFQIDSNLLEPKIRDVELGIEVSPPIGWKKSFLNPDNQIDLNQLQALKMLIGSNPQHIFQHQQTNSCCIVSKFTESSLDLNETFSSQIQKVLKEQFPKADVNHSSFSKNGLLINQILFISEKHVIIKLICTGDVLAAFEVVYIIPRVAYINQLRAIESSIGSILAL